MIHQDTYLIGNPPKNDRKPPLTRVGAVGMVVQDGCEVRLCDPCPRVSPCVPCVSRGSPWFLFTGTVPGQYAECSAINSRGINTLEVWLVHRRPHGPILTNFLVARAVPQSASIVRRGNAVRSRVSKMQERLNDVRGALYLRRRSSNETGGRLDLGPQPNTGLTGPLGPAPRQWQQHDMITPGHLSTCVHNGLCAPASPSERSPLYRTYIRKSSESVNSLELTHVTPCPEEPFCAFKSLPSAREVKRDARKVLLNPSTMLAARRSLPRYVSILSLIHI